MGDGADREVGASLPLGHGVSRLLTGGAGERGKRGSAKDA